MKMNVLLMLPGILLNLNFRFGLFKTILSVLFVVAFEIVLGLPFILVDYKAYFNTAF